ncbi:GTPase [Paenibacillus lemnae]|uniref:GTP-binding protein n=1 Tax=Paenibacillus lemnae TaxID=1330551 RepID=A0A848M567_PAELE|nr:GTPase [Paenibacillus lemnae]NMO94933.1 GTP-binding protein [Paenibacillus lemnae]
MIEHGEQWEEQISRAAEEAYEQEMDEINRQLDKEILIALIGDVNTGKSSTINRIVGEEVAGVGAEPGETVEIEPYEYKEHLYFIDTPGLNDVNKDHSEMTLNYYKKADIILFFLNAAGTVFSEVEKKSFERIQSVNKNILIVLNKIDAADEIDRLVARIRQETGGQYEVSPISSRTGENLDKLRQSILEILKKKSKDILFAKSIKEKSSTANAWIISASVSAGAVGASPVPGSDMIPITGIQIGLLTRLAVLYDRPISKETAKELVVATIVGNIGKSIFRQVIKIIPGAGSVAGASVAGAMTLALGYAVKYAYEHNVDLNADNLKDLYKQFSKKDKSE